MKEMERLFSVLRNKFKMARRISKSTVEEIELRITMYKALIAAYENGDEYIFYEGLCIFFTRNPKIRLSSGYYGPVYELYELMYYATTPDEGYYWKRFDNTERVIAIKKALVLADDKLEKLKSKQ